MKDMPSRISLLSNTYHFCRQGRYGGILTTIHSRNTMNEDAKTDNLMVYCTRPGSCIWKASVHNGEVKQTINYNLPITESILMKNDLSSTVLPNQEENNSSSELKSNSKYKSISHSFSLMYNQRINKNSGEHLSNILVTSSVIGLYFICLEDLTVINFIRLDKKLGTISKVILDPYFEDADLKGSKEMSKKVEMSTDEDNSVNYNEDKFEGVKQFPVYVLDSFNGFVQRLMIQPQRNSSCDKETAMLENTYERKPNTDDTALQVSFPFR